ncbi:2726_t:CDS:10, partial [Entrophospora sp. SA101]
MEENNNSYEKNENPNASNTRIIPTTFLDLLNNTLDDADLVHLLAEASIKVTPEFTAATLSDEDEEEDTIFIHDDTFGNDNDDLSDDETNQLADENFGRLLSQAQAIGSDLTTGTVAPHLWQNLEQEWSEFNQDLRLTSGIGPRNHALPPTLRAKVGEANLHYVNRDYPKAIEVLQEVIKIDPNIHSAWFTLGTIQDEIGCPEKALQLYLVAAHLTPHDGALWKRLDHSAVHQAIYCFSKAIRCDPNDAIDGFTGLLEKVPHDMNILREISKIHVQTSEIPKAIELYLDAYSYYQNRPFYEDAEAEGSFGYSEINIMAELYMLINDFGGAIEFIKCGVRWLQGREDETWWNNVSDDREYDEDENANRKDNSFILAGARRQGVFSSGGSNAPLPLELRIKLGISRICMDELEEGKLYDVKQYIDLYYEVAETYAEKGLFEDALTTYEAILLNSEVIDLGLCHRELGNFENAAEYFTAVVEDSPDNLDAKMSLAETYEFLGENEKALELVNTVLEARKFQRQVAESTPVRDPVVISLSSSSNSMTLQENQQYSSTTMNQNSGELIHSISRETKANDLARLEEERKKQELEKEKETQILFHRLDLLYPCSVNGDKEASKEYLETARGLIEDWQNNRAFYPPRNKMVPFRGYDVISLSSSSNSMTLQENQQYSSTTMNQNSGELIHSISRETKANDLARLEEERKKQELEKEKETQILFHRLDLLYPCSVNGDKEASKEYLETARGLIEDWQNNSILSSKKQGYDRCKSWREKLYYEEIKELKEGYDADIEEQATTMAKRLQWNIDGQLGELEAEIHKKMTEFQGITFEKWFEFFIQFIITATKNGHESEAYDVVMLVSKANIFYHNERHKTTFKVLSLAWGLYTSNYIVVCESARWLSANSQKYFLRQIKAMDSGISDSSPTKPDAGLLTLYGHILGCSRSYNGALGYYARAALVKPKDPLVCFSMGLAYLHRAMQRKTSNRHLQILQGFNFLYEYYELKGKNQEAEYNLGHAFHQLGLTHLAIPHYEKALKLPSVNQILKQKIDKKKQLETDENEEVENFEENDPTDIRKEAAYNLYLIYMETGSPALAQ